MEKRSSSLSSGDWEVEEDPAKVTKEKPERWDENQVGSESRKPHEDIVSRIVSINHAKCYQKV